MKKEKPKRLTSPADRAMARRIRDQQWRFMECVRDAGTLWWCPWNKNRHHDPKTAPEDLYISGLIDGMEMMEWMSAHKEWWLIGEWSEKRYARPIRLTPAGFEALANRHLYDMELVTGGLIEPGWRCTPARKASGNLPAATTDQS